MTTKDDFYSRLGAHHVKKLPFVVYKKPDQNNTEVVTAFLQKDDKTYYTEQFKETGFIFAPFDNQKKVILIPETASEKMVLRSELESDSEEKFFFGLGNFSENEKERYIELVTKALERLKTGEMEKVVLSREEEVQFSKRAPLLLFQDLLRNYPNAFTYCWYHPKIGLWMGATPETLLKVEGNQFITMALAGTQKFEGNLVTLWDKKEQQEQQIVTDAILQDLQALECVSGEIKLTKPFTSRAGNLLHLRTDISGHLEAIENLQELIYALHPTPAICGLPKEKAKNFILQEENYDRQFYTGFLGELNYQQVQERAASRRNVENLAYRTVKKQSSLFVNLRCMKIEDGKAILFIGGGITTRSIPEAEWQETVNKAETMKKVLLK